MENYNYIKDTLSEILEDYGAEFENEEQEYELSRWNEYFTIIISVFDTEFVLRFMVDHDYNIYVRSSSDEDDYIEIERFWSKETEFRKALLFHKI